MTAPTLSPHSAKAAAYDPRCRAGGVPRIGHLAGQAGAGPDLASHQQVYGPRPPMRPGELAGTVSVAGLTGRGGAGFPTARKLEAARNGSRAVLVANAAEGEPASAKDRTLLERSPHLFLDGLQHAADEIGAVRVVLCVPRESGLAEQLSAALAARRTGGLDPHEVEVAPIPSRFLAGEESALVSLLDGGPARPRFTPPRIFESGVGGAPTMVSNVETVANLALIARFGPDWFRSAGPSDEPGTRLVTVRGPRGWRVLETAIGTPLTQLLDDPLHVGGACSAVLVGGYHGTWLTLMAAREAGLSAAGLRALGATPGAGVVVGLPADRCGLAETARVVHYLAAESSGQCGPCLNGLPALAHAMAELAGPRPRPQTIASVHRWAGLITGRGACHHPDGSARLVTSALRTFSDELVAHQQGRCTASSRAPFLPVPSGVPSEPEDWR